MEQWEVIPGYNGRYEASSEGRIRRVKGKRCANGKIVYLSTFVGDYGYIRTAVVRNDGTVYKPGVHVLVALAFYGEPSEGMEVDHIDLDKSNNRLSNLEYVTHKQNHERARAIKGNWHKRGNGNSKLTEDNVRAIRASKDSQRVLGERYGVSQVAIFNVQKRLTWKHVE